MAPILKLYKATITAGASTTEYFFLQAPNSYAGSLDTVTGIAEAADTDKDEPTIPVSNLLGKGKLFRVVVQYTIGTARKSAKILVTKDKLATALDALIGKTFKGGTIVTARIPQKAQFF